MLEERGTRGAGSRDGKTMIGAYMDKTDLYTIQELLIRLTRERNAKVTMQDFIVSALRAECVKYGVRLSSIHINGSTDHHIEVR
jgi:hypothetical protein